MCTNNIFAKRLRQLREEKEMTQKDIANIVGTTDNAIGNYERGTRMPDAEMLTRLSSIFDVSIDYLLGRTDIRNAEDKISNALTDDPELLEFWEELKERPELQLLFKQTRELSDKDIRWLIRIIKTIEDEEDEIYG